MADDFISPFIASKVRNFTWKPWHPHRVLTHSGEPIAARIARLKSKFETTHHADSLILSNAMGHAISLAIGSADRDVSEDMRHALIDLALGLARQNMLMLDFPDIEVRSWTAGEAEHITGLLNELETRLEHDDRIAYVFLEGIRQLFTGYLQELRPPDEQSPFRVPLYTCQNPAELATKTILAFTNDLMPEADAIAELAFSETREQLFNNVLNHSHLSFEEYRKSPHKVVFPTDCDLDPERMMRTYLGNTPLLPFLETPTPFVIPQAARFEHCHIIGGTGHGKTQLLQSLALADFEDPEQPSVVIIDSQGDMVRKLSHLKQFADSDRLIIVDPSDTEWPLSLNIFDIHRERIDALSLGQREQILAGIIELYDYIFGAIGADLTQKQSVVFRYITRLMLDIPGANIQTLRQLMEDEKPFQRYIDRLTGTTRAFFDTEFSDKSFLSTKQQIRRRLYGILSNPTFERLFSSDKNKLDMATAINTGKVVLINTAKDVLKGEASSFFGRYMIALVMQAAFERAAIPEKARRPAFLYIDEAADYFDTNIDTLLIQARKFKLGVTLAHQFLDQLAPSLKASVMTNPAIRFAGGVSRKDANALDSDMRTTADFLMAMRKSKDATEFACYIRNVTPAAVKLEIPLGRVEREPAMTRNEYESILVRSRELVGEPLQAIVETQPPEASGPKITQADVVQTSSDPSAPSEW